VSRHASDRTPSSSVKCARSPAAGLTQVVAVTYLTGTPLHGPLVTSLSYSRVLVILERVWDRVPASCASTGQLSVAR
jgi:hypothetical protein